MEEEAVHDSRRPGEEEPSRGPPLATILVFAAVAALFVTGGLTPWLWGWNDEGTDVMQLGLLSYAVLRDGVKQTAAGPISDVFPLQTPSLRAAAAMLFVGAAFAAAAASCAALQLARNITAHQQRTAVVTLFPQLLLFAVLSLICGFAGTVIGCAQYYPSIVSYNFASGFASAVAGTVLCGVATFVLVIGGMRAGVGSARSKRVETPAWTPVAV